MGCRNGATETALEMPVTTSGDALLLATVCAVGLPVEVQAKDGSIYSGVFHTASLDEDYGIVLKKARITKKGRCSNLEVGAIVDTLVVLSSDLVQVIVKDLYLPMEKNIGFSDRLREGIEAVDSRGTGAASGNNDDNQENKSFNSSGDANIHETHHAKKLLESLDDNLKHLQGRDLCAEEVQERSHWPVVSVSEGQVADSETFINVNSRSLSETDSSTSAVVCGTLHSSSPSKKSITGYKSSSSPCFLSTSSDGCKSTPDISEEVPSSITSNFSSSASSDNNSTSSNVSTSPIFPSSDGNSIFSTCTKESKLNPEAKLFFPSFASARSNSVVSPNIVNTNYVSSFFPSMPATSAQSGLEINCFPNCTPLPAKFVQYSPLVAGQTTIIPQYSQNIYGQVNARQQPARFIGQYHPSNQAGTPYLQQNSQPVFVGRTGQLVYVHPIPQIPMQGTTVLSQGYHPALTPSQSNAPKVQGAHAQSLQFCLAQPSLVASSPVQPFAVPLPLPFSSPVPAIRPLSVPHGNGFFGTKFQ